MFLRKIIDNCPFAAYRKVKHMQNETIVIIDFGGQYNQLIARRVREANVYCEVVPYSKTVDEIKALNPKGNISPADLTVFL